MPVRTATGALVLVTSAVTLLLFIGDRTGYSALVAGFVPARAGGISYSELLRLYGLAPGAAIAVPWPLTPLTCTLLHGGLLHLGMNMLMLGFTGREAERAVGARGILILYAVGAYASAAAQWAVEPMSAVPMIGASGAASAVVGAYSLLFSQPKVKAIGPLSPRVVHILWLAIGWTVVNVMMWWVLLDEGISVAAAAHIGGFVAGLALARPLMLWRWRGA